MSITILPDIPIGIPPGVSLGASPASSPGSGFISQEQADCPPDLLSAARAKGQVRLVVVSAAASLPMQAAYAAWQAGIANPVLVGARDEILREADKLNWELSEEGIVPASSEADCAAKAAELVRQGLWGEGEPVGAIMKGQLHTDIFMGSLLDKSVGLRIGARLVHVFAIFPKRGDGPPILVSDAAVNVTPDDKTQQQSMLEMCRIARILGRERPKLAILSATESPISSMPSSLKALEYANWAQSEIANIDVCGPISFDLAISSQSANLKEMDNPVAGQADCLLVPEIVSGNILYKALVYLGGGCAAGIVVGGAIPVLLTSRADPPQSRLASIALASLVGAS